MYVIIFTNVSCASVRYLFFFFFNVFLNQNYELQFSCNVIIICNNKQYIVNYKQQYRLHLKVIDPKSGPEVDIRQSHLCESRLKWGDTIIVK
jgi:hypothetical protein